MTPTFKTNAALVLIADVCPVEWASWQRLYGDSNVADLPEKVKAGDLVTLAHDMECLSQGTVVTFVRTVNLGSALVRLMMGELVVVPGFLLKESSNARVSAIAAAN